MTSRRSREKLGKRVFEHVSKEAWAMWLQHSTMLINEYRIDLMSEAGQRLWMTELERFFFGEGARLPDQHVPVDNNKVK